MKCNGDGTPPCARCQRAGAACIFEPPWKSVVQRLEARGYGGASRFSGYHIGDLSYGPSPPDSASFHKRRRLNLDTLSTKSSPADESRNPYSTVLALDKDASPSVHTHKDSGTSPEGHVLEYLTKAGLSLEEALEMFALFGARIAPFMPTMLDIDFSQLSSSPLFNLAAIYTVARYLPETISMRMRCGGLLRELLEELLFERTEKKSLEYLRDNLHGLATLYAYCEANDKDVDSGKQNWRFDMLSIKGVIEGYAIKIGVAGMGSSRTHSDPIFSLYWLWLYTISH